jgi:hypothetical protein
MLTTLTTLTPDELSKALRGLSREAKAEVLELLELREQNKPEPVIDNRPSIDEMFRAVEPSSAWDMAVDQHYQRLDRATPWPVDLHGISVGDSLSAMHERFESLQAQAEALARADGHQDPSTMARKPEEAEDDQLERLQRAVTRRGGPIPRRDLLDSVIANTQEQQEQQRKAERVAAPPADDRLADFRNQGPLGWQVPGTDC